MRLNNVELSARASVDGPAKLRETFAWPKSVARRGKKVEATLSEERNRVRAGRLESRAAPPQIAALRHSQTKNK